MKKYDKLLWFVYLNLLSIIYVQFIYRICYINIKEPNLWRCISCGHLGMKTEHTNCFPKLLLCNAALKKNQMTLGTLLISYNLTLIVFPALNSPLYQLALLSVVIDVRSADLLEQGIIFSISSLCTVMSAKLFFIPQTAERVGAHLLPPTAVSQNRG